MTSQQIEAIYRENLGLGHVSALRAVFTQGYCLGAAIANSRDDLTPIPAEPSPTVKFRDNANNV